MDTIQILFIFQTLCVFSIIGILKYDNMCLKQRVRFLEKYNKVINVNSTSIDVTLKKVIKEVTDNYFNKTFFNCKPNMSTVKMIFTNKSKYIKEIYDDVVFTLEDETFDKITSLWKSNYKQILERKIESFLVDKLNDIKLNIFSIEKKDKLVQSIKEKLLVLRKENDNLQAVIKSNREETTLLQGNSYDSINKMLKDTYEYFVAEYFKTQVINRTPYDYGTKKYVFNFPANLKEKNDMINKIHQNILASMSESFKRRTRLFYSDDYLSRHLLDKVESEYNVQLEKAIKESYDLNEEHRRIMAENERKLEKNVTDKTIEKFKPLNSVLNFFGRDSVFPEKAEEIEPFFKKVGQEAIKELKYYKARYDLKRNKLFPIQKSIKPENMSKYMDMRELKVLAESATDGVVPFTTDMEDYVIAMIAEAMGWGNDALYQESIEKAKMNLIELAFEMKFNPVKEKMFGEHYTIIPRKTQHPNVQLINPRFYNKEVYDLYESPHDVVNKEKILLYI